MGGKRQTGEVIALILLFGSITLFTVAGFAFGHWAAPAASVHGAGVDGVIRYLELTTGTVLVIGAVAMLWFLWRYSRGRPTGSPQISHRAERWWTLVPVLGMALIAEAGVLLKGLPVWEQVYGEPPADAVVVDVTAQQFEWIVRYPGTDGVFGRTAPELVESTANPAGLDPSDPAAGDDRVLRNQVHVPAGRPVVVRLSSRDVLHSFSVPAFRVKQDVVPGIVDRTQFVPTTPGRYEIGCAELCGMGHYRMRAAVIVHTPEEYQTWLSNQSGGAQ